MDSPAQLIAEIIAREDMWTPQTLARNEYLIRGGEVEHSIYLVQRGALRVFFVSEFEEHTIRFGYTGSILTSLKSFYRATPSEYYIQAIRKTEIQVVPKKAYLEFVQENEARQRQYQALLEELVLQMMEREIDLLTHSPQERIRRVQARSPQLFQEIPAKYIAAYLRMTPETLSRLRNS